MKPIAYISHRAPPMPCARFFTMPEEQKQDGINLKSNP